MWLIGITIVTIVLTLILLKCQVSGLKISNWNKSSGDELGQLGDYIGGILGTLVSVITLIFFIFTFTEFKTQNKLIRKQNQLILDQYEHSTFVMLLHNYHEIINDLEAEEKDGTGKVTGREAMNSIIKNSQEHSNLKHIVATAVTIFNFPESDRDEKSEERENNENRRAEYRKNFMATLSDIEKQAIKEVKLDGIKGLEQFRILLEKGNELCVNTSIYID